MKKLGFVTPWYGKGIPGGAESELFNLAYHLHRRGVCLEILTTCVREFSANWNENYHKPGETTEDGIVVRRFPVREGDHELFHKVNAKLMRGENITAQEEEIFEAEIINSPQLYDYMEQNQEQYGLFIFIPYMFGTTYHGIDVCPAKSVLIPCLHDESYAYMSIFRERFSNIGAMIFHSKPESALANKIYSLDGVKQAVLGEGVDTDYAGKAKRFISKYKINKPFILYAGRKDETKNVHILIDFFSRYKSAKKSDLQLVLIGSMSLPIPENIKNDVHDLGFVSGQDKYDAYAAALLLCQPSVNESFSLVVMESWIAGRPVLVHGACDVTASFAEESGGGLKFFCYEDFEEHIDYLYSQPKKAYAMGALGKKYVTDNFRWDVITDKYLTFFKEMINSAGSAPQQTGGDRTASTHRAAIASRREEPAAKKQGGKKIYQLISTFHRGDAIGNNMLIIDKKLKAAGCDSSMYAINIEKKKSQIKLNSEQEVYSYENFPKPQANDLLIYHMSEGTKIDNAIAAMKCKKIAIYHNTTPAHFFAEYSQSLSKHISNSLVQIHKLCRVLDQTIADSEFNKQDLVKLGYDKDKITPIPVLIDFDQYKQYPDKQVKTKYK
ncbi:MAG: glycosyltransferase family 4 protein, partial [Oscillospiraceae bacterium]|nr:glycosyltransferase family 4 protein [Oscillospiraceae bacterium]